jgi:hypothetical protein
MSECRVRADTLTSGVVHVGDAIGAWRAAKSVLYGAAATEAGREPAHLVLTATPGASAPSSCAGGSGGRAVVLADGEAPELVAAVADDWCPVGEQEMVEVNLRGEPCEAVA